jgi:hypothetical protein
MTTSSAVSLFWIWLAAAFGLGLLWVLWIYIGPRLLRRLTSLRPYDRVYGERPRWDDASPRVRVTNGPTRLELVKRINPGQQPPGRGER